MALVALKPHRSKMGLPDVGSWLVVGVTLAVGVDRSVVQGAVDSEAVVTVVSAVVTVVSAGVTVVSAVVSVVSAVVTVDGSVVIIPVAAEGDVTGIGVDVGLVFASVMKCITVTMV